MLVVDKFTFSEVEFSALDSMLTTKISDPPYSCVSVKQHLSSLISTHPENYMLHEHAHNVSVLDDIAKF